VASDRRDVLCVSSIDWDFLWQGHQEIMSRLADAGHRVLFIENTGVRSPRLRDLPRLRQRFRTWRHGANGFRQERPNLTVYSPLVLPLPYSRAALRVNLRLMRGSLGRWMRGAGFSRPIVWTFLPTLLARNLAASVDPALTVYYCVDDLASSSPEASRIKESEPQCFSEADLVFVTSEKLRARAAQFASRVHLFPFGVNLTAFAREREQGSALPDDLAALSRPIVGYIGGLHRWLDQALLATVATCLPDVSFALVGPPQVNVGRLERLPNVTLFGQRAPADLPRYLRGFDVGIVPYLLTEYTSHVYPTKLNEYLAMGLPVVATDLAEVRRFNREHGNDTLVRVAADADAFTRLVQSALRPSTTAERAQRIKVAESHSWERRLAAMSALIEAVAAEKVCMPKPPVSPQPRPSSVHRHRPRSIPRLSDWR
jgi:glycosyltransferase involved in cell wall biosynthesis